MPNRLVGETSPYLQQHANNPVEWYPWGEQALALALDQDKPILLSIGYSACHWCHVMAHECFEDTEVAALMNRWFINIKVDREERPDLDHIYQTAHHMLTQRSGGWPLTLFLSPDQTPYFGGTYFPKAARRNLPGMTDLLPRTAEFYRARRGEIGRQNAALQQALAQTLPVHAETSRLHKAPLVQAVGQLRRSFDPVNGGFGGAPKFPRPVDLDFCLRHIPGEGRPEARDMALTSLRNMARGGIYDHLGGGFFRYSVDDSWLIPHFEKMLYDNGPLLALYSDAFVLTGEECFRRVVQDTAAWVEREMQAADGGYFSSLDADSAGREGQSYLWTPAEAVRLLSAQEFALAAPYYGLDQPPNFDGAYWHLHAATDLAAVAAAQAVAPARARQLIAGAAQKLWAARRQRAQPGRDEKVLVSWNALMIKGMARAGRLFARPGWLASAQRAADFVRTAMWRNGRLLAAGKNGHVHLNAYLDDYAFMLDALLELLQGEFRRRDLEFARQLADGLLARFEDPQAGGFFFTSHDHETLIHRPKPAHDGALPAGNGVAVSALQRIGHLLQQPRYLEAAERTLKLFYPLLAEQPSAFTSMASALDEFLAPPALVILRGDEPAVAEWAAWIAGHYLPGTMLLALPRGLSDLPHELRRPASDPVSAWVCRGVKCLPAIHKRKDLLEACKSVIID